MRLLQRLAHLCTIAAAAWFAFWACAPPSTLPPPIPMGAEELRLGAALTGGNLVEPTWTEQPDGSLELANVGSRVIDGRISATKNLEERLGWPCEASVVVFGGQTTMLGGGLMTRCDLLPSARLYLGPQIEGGLTWAGLGLPVAVQLGPRLLVHTTPTYRLAGSQQVLLPVGVAWNARGRLWLTTDLSARFTRPLRVADLWRPEGVYALSLGVSY